MRELNGYALGLWAVCVSVGCGQGTVPSPPGGTSGGPGTTSGASSGSSSQSPSSGASSSETSNGGSGAHPDAGSGAGSSQASSSGNSGASSASSASSSGGGGDSGADGGSNPNCPGAEAGEYALIQSWLNDSAAAGALPNYAYTNVKTNFPAGAAFDQLACSIAMSCVEWAPMEANWLRQCEAVLTSAIVAESSYNPSEVVMDTYASRTLTDGTTASDPTVGLLQIRFSSTVHDFNYNGPLAKMTPIGCNWPSALTSQADAEDFWGTAGATTYLSFMEQVACNIGLASWYYFYNATGNGGSSPIYIAQYCAGQGVAGDMVEGLLSHLDGPQYARPADDTNAYPWGIECCACGNPSVCTCTGCTGRFAAFMGIGTTASRPSPDPFLQTLSPEPSKYCN